MRIRILRIDMSSVLPVSAESTQVEAARHALLRRLAPSLRHDAVSSLQPISLAGSVLERRLQSPSPDLPALQGAVHQLIDCSRHAVQSCLDVIAWLGLDNAREVALDQGIADAVTLLQGGLGFRGFTLRIEGPGHPARVASGRLRHVLPACLLWLSDGASAPAELVLRAVAPGQAEGDDILASVQLLLVPMPDATNAHPHPAEPAYRPLRDEEVQALAHAEGVRLSWSGDTLSLQLLR